MTIGYCDVTSPYQILSDKSVTQFVLFAATRPDVINGRVTILRAYKRDFVDYLLKSRRHWRNATWPGCAVSVNDRWSIFQRRQHFSVIPRQNEISAAHWHPVGLSRNRLTAESIDQWSVRCYVTLHIQGFWWGGYSDKRQDENGTRLWSRSMHSRSLTVNWTIIEGLVHVLMTRKSSPSEAASPPAAATSKQHCRMLQVERFFRQSCFDIVAVFLQQWRTKFRLFDKVDTNWKTKFNEKLVRILQYSTLSKGRYFTINYSSTLLQFLATKSELLRQSRPFLRHCC